MNYDAANRQMTGRCSMSRKVANNTYLERDVIGGNIYLRLHRTRIMTFKANGDVTLNSGGWLTVTTKARMNEFLDSGYRVWSDKGVWYLSHGGYNSDSRIEVAYEDGITIHSDGSITGQGEDPRAKLKLKRRIKGFAEAYMENLFKGKIPAPSAGDCMMCAFKMPESTDHLDSHMEEKYYVPSLMMRAIERFDVSACAKSTLGKIWTGKGNYPDGIQSAFGDSWRGIAREQLTKSLRRFITAQYGMQA